MRIVKEAYKHLATYLQTEVPEIQWLDLWYEQVLIPELTEAIQYPAVFFEIAAGSLESMGLWEQRITLRTSVYIAQVSYLDTALAFPDIDPALNYLEILAKIHEVLQGYEHPDTGNLNRVAFEPVQTPTNLIIYRITYEHVIDDITPMEKRRQTQSVSPVDVCIIKDLELPVDTGEIALTYPLPMPLQNEAPPSQNNGGGGGLFFID